MEGEEGELDWTSIGPSWNREARLEGPPNGLKTAALALERHAKIPHTTCDRDF